MELIGNYALPDVVLPLENARNAILGFGNTARLLAELLDARGAKGIFTFKRTCSSVEMLANMFHDPELRIETKDTVK